MTRFAVAHRWRAGCGWLHMTRGARGVALRCRAVGKFVTVAAQTRGVASVGPGSRDVHGVIHWARQFVVGWSHRGHGRLFPRHNRKCAGGMAHRANLVTTGIKLTLMATTVGAWLVVFVHAGRLDLAVAFNLMAAAARGHVNATVLMNCMRKRGLGPRRDGRRSTGECTTIFVACSALRAGRRKRGLAVVTLGLAIIHLRPWQCIFAGAS